jgi:aconitate hydratase
MTQSLLQIVDARLHRLPIVLRLLLENLARNTQGAEREQGIKAITDWLDHGTSQAEIPFLPLRILMHDTTSTPALVDIAAMRDQLAETGRDPEQLQPRLPIDICVDHSTAIEAYAVDNAADINMGHEIRRNAERYQFLRWAAGALQGVRINPPGSGIMHTINMEQLATVVTRIEQHGQSMLVPDTVLGTDSHTPMINGLGILGWGVGGLEAQTVMFGLPTMLRIPDVIGVKLLGQLPASVQSTDLALVVTHQLRKLNVSGEFVEFFGPGVSSLSANDRCVIANMAPEYGATTGFFPVDDNTLAYLRRLGRTQDQLDVIGDYCTSNALWFDPALEPRYTKTIEIDLGSVQWHIAGPRRPQDLLSVGEARQALESERGHANHELANHGLTNHGLTNHKHRVKFPVAIAAITSCTNTSDPRQLIIAGLFARNARAHGASIAAWVKTSLAPGSPSAKHVLDATGLQTDLNALGFHIAGFGCTTCIGNSGPLPQPIQEFQSQGQQAVAVLSGNRNFPTRVHPDIGLSFIMSPMLVVAFAIAGRADIDMFKEPLLRAPDGQAIYLRDLVPSQTQIDQAMALSVEQVGFASTIRQAFTLASSNPQWHALPTPTGEQFPWLASSTILQRPPFADADQSSQLGHYTAHALLLLGDDITTDLLSPASAIPPDSLVADFLVARGDARNDLNVFASRRGNWQVMMRAAFHSKSLTNLLAPNIPLAHTLHCPSGDVVPIWEAAQRYRTEGASVVIIAGERYGMGSSRDWAAKGQRLLGVRAVIAKSFERIHRSNLIGMGILPLLLPQDCDLKQLALKAHHRYEIFANTETLSPRCAIRVMVHGLPNQDSRELLCKAAVETSFEVDLLKQGGVIPAILNTCQLPAK